MANKILKHDHFKVKGSLSYPSILVEDEYPDLLPLGLGAIKDTTGLPVIVYDGHGGLTELPIKVPCRPSTLDFIVRLYPIRILLGPEESILITKSSELLEKEGIPWTD